MTTDSKDFHGQPDCIGRVKAYIQAHLNEPLDRATLADIAGYSIPHFHRIFTNTTGESAISYVRRLRLKRAGQKLRMGAVNITEVALAAGYQSHAAFSKSFKKEFGISPDEFRRLNCKHSAQMLRRIKNTHEHCRDEHSSTESG